MRISRRARFENVEAVAPHQFSVLARLESGPSTPRALAEIEFVSAPSMTRTVNKLVEAELVERAGDPDDGRRVTLTLTQAGKDALETTRHSRDAWMIERLDDLPEEELDILAKAQTILAQVAAR